MVAVLGYLAYERYQQRAPVLWDMSTASYVAAAPGHVGQVAFSYEMLRRCVLDQATTRLTLTDVLGGHFSINQRTGVPSISAGAQDRTIRFEVPRFAHPGPASVSVSGLMRCNGARVWIDSPQIPFTVGAGDGSAS